MSEQAILISHQIISAFQRVRALLFTMTLLCSLLLANIYVEAFSLDTYMIQDSYFIANKIELGLKEIEAERTKQDEDKLSIIKLIQDNPDSKAQFKKLKDLEASEAEKNRERDLKYSGLQSQQLMIKNTQKDYKLRSITLPLIGLSIPANDANVILGIFMSALAVWILYSIHQIHDALNESSIQENAQVVAPILRSAAVFTYPLSASTFKIIIINSMFLLPAATILLALTRDLLSIATYPTPDQSASMSVLLFFRIVILTGILSMLSITSYFLINNSKKLSTALYRDTSNSKQTE
jgi:hypothetical protein